MMDTKDNIKKIVVKVNKYIDENDKEPLKLRYSGAVNFTTNKLFREVTNSGLTPEAFHE